MALLREARRRGSASSSSSRRRPSGSRARSRASRPCAAAGLVALDRGRRDRHRPQPAPARGAGSLTTGGSTRASSGDVSGVVSSTGATAGCAPPDRGKSRMSPMTTPRSPRSTRLLHATLNPPRPSSRAPPVGRSARPHGSSPCQTEDRTSRRVCPACRRQAPASRRRRRGRCAAAPFRPDAPRRSPPHGVRLVATAETAIWPELEASRPVEDDEDLLLGAVAVRRVDELLWRNVEKLQAGLLRARGTAQVADCTRHRLAFAHPWLDVANVDDPRRPLGQLADLRRADRDLPCPGMVVGAPPRAPTSGRATTPRRAGAACSPRSAARRRRGRQAHSAPLGGYGRAEREMHEAVPRPDAIRRLVGAVALNRDARSVEDEEDLLLRALEMKRCRPLPGVDPDPLHARPTRGPRP